jgi:hypothetical protein
MAPWIARGMQKPAMGAQVNPDHPFARGLRLLIPFHEGLGVPANASANAPYIIRTGEMIPAPASSLAVSGTFAWTSNTAGPALSFTTTATSLNMANDATVEDIVPADAVTIALIRRKLDTTNRTAKMGGLTDNTEAAVYDFGITSAGDTTVKFFFGGYAGANALSYDAGTPVVTVQAWIFAAGPQGSSMWLNGVKVAGQTALVTRSLSTGAFLLNNGSFGTGGDTQEFNWLQVNKFQWPDDQCRWWSAEPYAHLYPPPTLRKYFLLGGGVSPETTGRSLAMTGVG